MPGYTFKNCDPSATRQSMEQIVEAFNKSASAQIQVIDYKVGRLVIEADEKTFAEFKAQHTDWELHPVSYADCNPPSMNVRRFFPKPEPDKN
jgi:hypothetical protein